MRVALMAAALLSAAPLAAQEAPGQDRSSWSAEQWREAAVGDILAAYRTYIENHPGIYDLANPEFAADLARARTAGLAAAARATDAHGYARALGQFNAVLSDGHALAYSLRASNAGDDVRLWPGFVAVWRGERLLAAYPERSAALHGAEIVACDGKPIRDFLRGALLTRAFRPREEGQWWSRSPQVFYTSSEFAADTPQRCTFVPARGGAPEDVALEWREADEQERQFFSDSVQGEVQSIGLSEPRPGLFHIAMPTFHPDEEGRTAYRMLFDQVTARRDELKAARAVVLDLRRNGGGSSEWSHQLAALLWGDEPLAARASDVSILWRTSAANSAYVGEAAKEMIAQGRTRIGEGWTKLAVAMDAARARGEPLYDQSGLEEEEQADTRHESGAIPASDFTTPVYVITHGGCASACLDAIDYFKRFENIRLIGAPTSADSTYMDVRRETLPSGAGAVVIPNKVWVGRTRGWGVIYHPDIVMDRIDWSTDAFLDRIEQDLASRSEP